jgi:DNA-binding SARP family transcriptional activator/Tol biopolymer transport system component
VARYQLRTLVVSPCLLGGTGESERIRFSKQLAVVIYLASRPRSRASRDELLNLLWGDASKHDARSSLRQVLYQIRGATDPEFVVGDEVLYLRRENVDLDVDFFRLRHAQGELESALEVYEADFLSSVGLAGAREFEAWADGVRQQLAAEHRQLLRTLISRASDAAKWSEGAGYAELLIEADPGVLEPRLKLVQLLARSGDAIRASSAAAEARAFAESIEGQRLSAEVEQALAQALSPVARTPSAASAGFPLHPDMVGRAAEFRLVLDKWNSALAGRGGSALLMGEAGIGKTRLARELIARFRRNHCLVLQSACYGIEQSDPLAPFADLLRAAAGAPGLGGASPRCLAVLGAFIPEIADRFRPAIQPLELPVSPQTLSTAVLDALGAITDEIPLALVVEDLHWATPETIEFAHRLARRAQSHHMLLLLTARDYGDAPGTTDALRGLTGTGAVKEVPLGPLDTADVRQLLASVADLPDEASGRWLAAQLVERTEGVPLYVLEVLKSLHDSGALVERGGRWEFGPGLRDAAGQLPIPASARAILESRLNALGDRPAALLAAMAIWGRAADADVLTHLTGLDHPNVERALAALERRRLAIRAGESVTVAHEELAAAALRGTPPTLLVQLHERAARLARDAARNGRPGDWLVAARYAAFAGRPERAAVDAARAVAEVQRSSGRAAGREALLRALNAMPAEVRGHLQLALQPVLEDRWSARRWLAERSGRPKRTRWAAGLVGAALLLAAASIISHAVGRHVPAAPLGKGLLALTWGPPGHLDSVQALRIDAGFAPHHEPQESLPPGVQQGIPQRLLRAGRPLAAVTCSLRGVDFTGVCLRDLTRGTTSTLARYDGDATPLGWLPDGSALLVLRSYPSRRLGYTYGLVLIDSTGRLRRTVTRDSAPFDNVVLAPSGDQVMALRSREGRTEAALLTLEGTLLGIVDWCNRAIAVAWSPDGGRLACLLDDAHQLQIGDARPGSWPTHILFADAIQGGPVWSGDGQYLAVSVGGRRPGVYVVDRAGLMEPRRVASYPAAPRLIGWLGPAPRSTPSSIQIDSDHVRLAVGDTAALHATGLGTRNETLGEVEQVRWRSADTTVARVDEDGRLVADRPGSTYVIATFGVEGASDTAYVNVNASPTRLLLDENFDHGLNTARWQPFGDPPPRVLQGAGRAGTGGLDCNGNYSYSSGIALRLPLAVDRGLTIEYWARVPITRNRWQSVKVGLYSALADSFRLGPGPPQPASSFAAVALEAPLRSQSRRRLMAVVTDARPSLDAAPLPDNMGDGSWHRYRLVIYPGREVRWLADGREHTASGRADLGAQPLWTLVLEGRSVGTLAILDDLKVWEGVVLPVQPEPGSSRKASLGRVPP